MTIDRFANKADRYEQNQNRVDNVANIAQAILDTVQYQRDMHIIDFGSGTGLLLEKLAPHVRKITAVDTSPAMNRQLEEKRSRIACDLEVLEVDLVTTRVPLQVDGIVSSMTMHHIENIDAMFSTFHSMVRGGGFIAISDLDLEDGSFHSDDTGVFHHGFDRDAFARAALGAGFKQVQVASASVVHKPPRAYGVFLLTAIRPADRA